MRPMLDLRRAAPGVLEALERPGEYLLRTSDLEPELLALVRAYVSHLNGCSACADRFARETRIAGEDEQRLQLLPFWREAPFHTYTARERAALAWAEVVTSARRDHVREELHRPGREEFSERDLADLTLAVVSTIGWNRVALVLGVAPPDPSPQNPPRRTSESTAEGTTMECALCGAARAANHAAGAAETQWLPGLPPADPPHPDAAALTES